ncbi:hypothetical protein CERSUDRAFT_95481 [Gelatoporia subvermispora B]|uniref:Uncharacterized protein n=1 Tax=Ceriporiopsis subvermispora (strain B) TaxID=914234 RepID=M2REG1_CERS8|nr:hypothetical protein CERSUDRAFT_95481 [Gelatoporia subvermispora B]
MSTIILISWFLTLVVSVNALPLGPPPEVEYSPLVVAYVLVPFPILAAVKYMYLKFRKSQTIHAVDQDNQVVDEKSSSVSTRGTIRPSVSHVLTGYLVGLFGSPEWETRIKCRSDRVKRKAEKHLSVSSKPSSTPRSQEAADSTGTTGLGGTSFHTTRTSVNRSSERRSHLSRVDSRSVSWLDMRSPILSPDLGDIISCASVHPSSPACSHYPTLPSLPPAAHMSAPSVHLSTGSPSPTLMQIMEPVLSSWYDESGPSNQNSSQDQSASSGINSSQDRSVSGANSTSQSSKPSSGHHGSGTGRATTSSFETPPTSPNSDNVVYDVPILVPRAFSTSSSVEPKAISSDPLTVSIFEAPSVPVPVPIYSVQPRARACDVVLDNWPVDPALKTSPFKALAEYSSSKGSSSILDVLSAERTPLAQTTRPLNVLPKSSPPSTFPSPSSPSPPATPSFTSEIIARALQQPSKAARRLSMSPPLGPGPSPLRHSALLDVPASASVLSLSASAVSLCVSLSSASRGSWELDDLVKDGQLDIDAVSAALGLGISRESSRRSSRVEEDEICGESSVYGGEADTSASSSGSSGMGWGRARESGITTLVLRTPGAPLCAIPEETDDVAELWSRESGILGENSGLSALERFVDGASPRRESGGDVSLWEEEGSWRDSVSYRDSIGLAC